MDGPPQKKTIPFKPPVPPTGGMTGRRGKTSQQPEGLTSKDRDSPRITPTKLPTVGPKAIHHTVRYLSMIQLDPMGSNMSLSQESR